MIELKKLSILLCCTFFVICLLNTNILCQEYDTLFTTTNLRTPLNGQNLGSITPNPPTTIGFMFWGRLTFATIQLGWKSFTIDPLDGVSPSLINGKIYDVISGTNYQGVNYVVTGSYDGPFNAYSYDPANPFSLSLAGQLREQSRYYRGTMLDNVGRRILVVLNSPGSIEVRYDVLENWGDQSWKKWDIAYNFSYGNEYTGGDILDCYGEGVVWAGRKIELVALKIDVDWNNIGSPSHQVLGNYELGGDVSQIRKYQDALYVLLYNSKLAIFDVTDPTPVFERYLDIPDLTETGALNIHYTSSYGTLLLVGGDDNINSCGLAIYTLEDPHNPTYAKFDRGEFYCYHTYSIVTSYNSDDVFLACSNDVKAFKLTQKIVPVPVELSSFTALVAKKDVYLKWRTESESNNYGFEIERKLSNDWKKIGFIVGNGTTTEPQQYELVDNLSNIQSGDIKFYYRLKQIDTDGSYEYSQIVSVNLKQIPENTELHQNYPNPFNPSSTISYSIAKESFVTLKIYDVLGKEIQTLVNEIKEIGDHSIIFNASQLSSGIYFYKLQAGDFIEINKMILMQ